MNKYQQLANIIFPEVTDTIADLEARYPARNLPEGAMVTRFAPSPTGFLHTGSLFASMCSRKFAKQSGGVFFLRLEDTDTKREIAGSGNSLITQLAVFGVTQDEGYNGDNPEFGNYGPYVQSQRAEIYKTVIKYMLENNLAYPCFCSPEELTSMRKSQEEKKENFGYYGPYAKCSTLPVDVAIERIQNGEPFVIRFRSNGDYRNKVIINDAIRGTIEMAENDQHIVIYKSDGLPTYHFAHLVDDHFMHTTHVTRGEEWMPSLPIHVELFNTMGWEAPKYAHLPVIMKLDNGNRRKLSKRKDEEAAVSFFLEQGYPVEGFMEYLYTIANSNYEGWRLENPKLDKDEFNFSFEKMSLDGALFDLGKVKFFCKEKLGNMTPEEFAANSYEYAKQYDSLLCSLIEKDYDYYKQIVSIEREQEKPRKDYEKFADVAPLIKFFYDEHYNEMVKEGYPFPETQSKENVKKLLEAYVANFNLDLSEEDWFANMKEIAVSCGYAATPKEWKKNKEAFPGHVGDLAGVLRAVLSLRLQSPNLYNIMQILGKERVIERINNALETL